MKGDMETQNQVFQPHIREMVSKEETGFTLTGQKVCKWLVSITEHNWATAPKMLYSVFSRWMQI